MSWHTQFRPRQVKDLHLTPVREQLLAFMESGSFPRVFLFAGPKGTGKTSASRIIGAVLNDPINAEVVDGLFLGKKKPKKMMLKEPDPSSSENEAIFTGHSYVVNEMDAASNRRIDDVRSLKDRVVVPPQTGKMSVYILDEAHMFTNEAFNALLKLLEEPPAHAVFILATTERHKIPETVLSRTTELRFRKASSEELQGALKKVAKETKIKTSKEALEAIASRANGSFRDAVKLFEQVFVQAKGAALKKELTVEDVQTTLAQAAGAEQYHQLLEAVVTKDETTVVKLLHTAREHGQEPSAFYQNLLSYLHAQLLQAYEVQPGKPAFSQKIVLFLLDNLWNLSAQDEAIPLLQLEIILLKVIDKAKQQGNNGGVKKKPKSVVQTHASKSSTRSIEQPSSSEQKTSSTLPPTFHSDSLEPVTDDIDTSELLADWQQFVELVRNRNATIAALLNSAKPLPEKSNGVAKVAVFYSFHREQLMQPKISQLLQDCAQEMIGGRPAFAFEMQENKEPVAQLADQALM